MLLWKGEIIVSDMTKPVSLIAYSNESTVVSDYKPNVRNSSEYESEAKLEENFIKLLQGIGYTYLKINSEEELLRNLRSQIERLNHYKFLDSEWQRFKDENICNNTWGIVERTKIIQKDYIREFVDNNGVLHNIKLIDKEEIHNNYLQVINQYSNETDSRKNRYDVTILVNGLPLVHIELKRRGVNIQEAFNQINRYQRDSFWSNCGLYEYIQIFVISNGTDTKYYSNTTRDGHIKESQKEGSRNKTSNSFEFTSYWADEHNRNILDLIDFTKTFLTKRTLLNVLTKYCVLTCEDLLLVMRPYQIVATEKIVNKVIRSSNSKQYGTIDAGGYIWHTTGSGKTLTSFKTAQLLSKIEGIDKVLFVVDRKDLDYQTKKEYDRFQRGAANSSNSTSILKRQLEDKDEHGADEEYKIIITTIQKLSSFLKSNPNHPVYNKHIVFIFDECHRSQFGEMHKNIVKSFKKYHLFGFTGTPIFAKNSPTRSKKANKKGGYKDEKVDFLTTEQTFGERLHTYTIINAIYDGNVLPFYVDFIDTMRTKNGASEARIKSVDEKRAISDDKRIENVVRYLLENYDTKTKSNVYYNLKGKKVRGFNSLFATDSKAMAVKYYKEIKKQNNEREEKDRLKVALIYTWMANEADLDSHISNGVDNSLEEKSARDYLEEAIIDYNLMFHTNFDTGSGFEDYRDSISDKMKNRELDLLIVVDMFLTGFDSTTLNTLWVDKNLEQHGLIQAFSRTNRILNSVKNCGNIICFRNLSKKTDEAIALFGDAQARSLILLKDFKSYYNGYDDKVLDNNGKVVIDEDGKEKVRHIKGYQEMILDLKEDFPLGENRFDTVAITKEKEKAFIVLWGAILKMRNILSCFDEFKGKKILTDIEFQDYNSIYLRYHDKYKRERNAEKEYINDDIVFEMDLVKSVEVDIDYILKLILKYHNSNMLDKELYAKIMKSVEASTKLRSKKELIEQFILEFNTGKNDENIADMYNGEEREQLLKKALNDIDLDIDKLGQIWVDFANDAKKKELERIIEENGLKEEETKRFVENCFADGVYETKGSNFNNILPKKSFFGGASKELSDRISDILNAFFEKYKNG